MGFVSHRFFYLWQSHHDIKTDCPLKGTLYMPEKAEFALCSAVTGETSISSALKQRMNLHFHSKSV